jgi:hypothetical protein
MRRIEEREDDFPEHDFHEANQLPSHREIGAQLGIGRARVFFHEHSAIKKMRKALASQGIECQADLECVPVLRAFVQSKPPQRQLLERFSSLHGWLRADRIVSLNAGCNEVLEIAEAFKLLKLAHENLVRPPLLLTTPEGVKEPYRIEAVGVRAGALFVRCWPNACAPRTVAALTSFPCTVIVESIFDRDAQGDFDIPLIDCVIVSAREAEGLKL